MSSERSKLRILIADDHPMFRLGLAMALRSLGFGQVDEAVDGESAVELCRGRKYDIVLLDLRMPRLNGVEAARQIHRSDASGEARDESPAVILLTTFDEPAVVSAAADAGAAAFLSKDVDPQALARVIDRVAREPGVSLMPEARLPHLAPREHTVMKLVVEGKTLKDIAKQLGISTETVRDHLSRVYGKLDVKDRVGLVRAARRYGWVVLEEMNGLGK